MGKILAFDIGDEWKGSAISDDLKIVATPLKTVTKSKFEEFLRDISEKENLEEVVIGYPKTMSGKISQQTEKVLNFFKDIEAKFPKIKFILWDERLSSKRAESIKGKHDKKHSHSIAAAFILDSYLNNLAFKKSLES